MYELRFHEETDRWCVYDGAKMMYPLHCGDALKFEIDGVFHLAAIELDADWYATFGGVKFWLHTRTKYNVNLCP